MKKNVLFLSRFLTVLFMAFLVGLSQEVMACYSKVVIKILSQDDFNSLNANLLKHIANGEKNIDVVFSKGQFYYKHQHVYWADKQLPDVSIRFYGNGSSIISGGRNLESDGIILNYNEKTGFVDLNGQDYQNYSRIFQSNGNVEIIDENFMRCRVFCSELKDYDNSDCKTGYIRLTSWFTSFLYPVTQISDGYVYFIADNLTHGYAVYGDYNVNYDYTVGKIFPRFRLINIPVGGCEIVSKGQGIVNKSDKVIHLCESGFFVSFLNCEFKNLTIEGFKIIGCRSDSQFFRFRNIKAQSITIRNSTFTAARGMALYAEQTDNITIEQCVFYENYQSVVNLENTCANATIKDNRFYNNGKGLVNSFCVICRGGNYLITNNVICDFNYGAIGVGVWYKAVERSKPSFGIVERNHIYYTSDYIKEKAEWTLVDGGAIYLCSKNDGAVIRYNFIHDYEGMGSNRGIYCDDGTNNCSIYGNIVLNINNSRGIDLRRSKTIENAPVGQRSNENNHIFGNVFNNDFLFEGRDDDSTSVKGGNTILVNSEASMPKMIVKNIVEESQDRISEYKEKLWYRKGKRLIR